jgi:ABC-type branched-subunit amino acid transport system substrate-binding protein
MQAIAGADYATNTLHATKVVVFVDQGKLYSQSLAQHFLDRFRANGGQIVAEEQYVVGKPENLGRLLNNALEQIASRG